MVLEVNGARGEVPLKVGGIDLVIAATMNGLANVSTRLECKSLGDLFLRLSGVEIAATRAAVELLTIRGDVAAALKKLKLKDFKACADAFSVALAHHFQDDDEGNAEAAPVAAG